MRPRLPALVALIVAVSVGPTGAQGQTAPTEAQVTASRLREAQDPSLGSTDVGLDNQIEIEASTKDSKGKLRIGSRSELSQMDQRRAWSLVMEAKLDDEDETAVLGDLDGLSDDFAATYTHAFLFWKPAITEDDDKLRLDLCRKDAAERNAVFNPSDVCNLNALQSEVYKRQWDERIHRLHPITRLALSAKAGYSKFDFFDATTLDGSDDRKVGYSFSGTFSRLTPIGGVPFVGLRLEHAFKNADKVQVCEPGPVANTEECVTKPLGPPTETDSVVIFGEWRKFYRRFAVSPRISYETKESTTGVRIPFWFLTNDKGGFTGGMRLDWNDDTHDAAVSVFVSSPLSLLTN